MATITAQIILDENNYAVSDISLANMGYLIDNAINYTNLVCGTSISNLVAGSVTVTAGEAAVVKTLSAMLLRAYVDRGPNASVGGLVVTSVIADPQYSLFQGLLKEGLDRLRGRSFLTT